MQSSSITFNNNNFLLHDSIEDFFEFDLNFENDVISAQEMRSCLDISNKVYEGPLNSSNPCHNLIFDEPGHVNLNHSKKIKFDFGYDDDSVMSMPQIFVDDNNSLHIRNTNLSPEGCDSTYFQYTCGNPVPNFIPTESLSDVQNHTFVSYTNELSESISSNKSSNFKFTFSDYKTVEKNEPERKRKNRRQDTEKNFIRKSIKEGYFDEMSKKDFNHIMELAQTKKLKFEQYDRICFWYHNNDEDALNMIGSTLPQFVNNANDLVGKIFIVKKGTSKKSSGKPEIGISFHGYTNGHYTSKTDGILLACQLARYEEDGYFLYHFVKGQPKRTGK